MAPEPLTEEESKTIRVEVEWRKLPEGPPADKAKSKGKDKKASNGAAGADGDDDEDLLDYEEEEAGAIANKALGVVETAASGPDTVTLHSRFVPDDVSAKTLRRALRSIPGFVRVGFSVPHAQRQKVRLALGFGVLGTQAPPWLALNPAPPPPFPHPMRNRPADDLGAV